MIYFPRPAAVGGKQDVPWTCISDPFLGGWVGWWVQLSFNNPNVQLDCKMQLIYLLMHRVGVFKTELIHLCMFDNLARRRNHIMNDA